MPALLHAVQMDGRIPVFKQTECSPCEGGITCKSGVQTLCPPGTASAILGATACTACPPGTVSDAGGLRQQRLTRLAVPHPRELPAVVFAAP